MTAFHFLIPVPARGVPLLPVSRYIHCSSVLGYLAEGTGGLWRCAVEKGKSVVYSYLLHVELVRDLKFNVQR